MTSEGISQACLSHSGGAGLLRDTYRMGKKVNMLTKGIGDIPACAFEVVPTNLAQNLAIIPERSGTLSAGNNYAET